MPARSSSVRRRTIAAVMLAAAFAAATSSCTAVQAEPARLPVAGKPEPCPPLASYGAEEQARAAAELEALSTDSVLAMMLDDYLLLRDQCRRGR